MGFTGNQRYKRLGSVNITHYSKVDMLSLVNSWAAECTPVLTLLTGTAEQSVGGQLLQDHRMTHYGATGRSEVERV